VLDRAAGRAARATVDLIVLRQAFTGVRRFEQFSRDLGISRSLLTDRLNRLVEAGVLERHAYRASSAPATSTG